MINYKRAFDINTKKGLTTLLKQLVVHNLLLGLKATEDELSWRRRFGMELVDILIG